jgi:hypothetical protein
MHRSYTKVGTFGVRIKRREVSATTHWKAKGKGKGDIRVV